LRDTYDKGSRFHVNDRVVLIEDEGYNPTIGLKKGTLGLVVGDVKDGRGCLISFDGITNPVWLFDHRIELITENDETYLKGNTMHNDRKVLLINDDIKVIRSAYDAHEDASTTEFKTFNADLAVGDLILVPTGTRHKLAVNKIIEVDVKADWESSSPLPWVAGKVDNQEYVHCLAQEATILEAMKDADKNKRAKEIKQAMVDSVEDGVLQITAAPAVAEPDTTDTSTE